MERKQKSLGLNIGEWTHLDMGQTERENEEQGRCKQKSDHTHLIKPLKLIKIVPRLSGWQHIFNLFWGAV